ncbi:MAG TPA: biotin--[acetyl-CoA-carboxylase] ligase [Thermoplasmata archaeon]|nr:biotin--[acetyl-CoA-carboxylase] ligase [Thermoplasmata archaeon]
MATREAYAELASTQDRAIALARDGAEEGSRVVAGRQTAGRGRLDHGWASPTGGLYLSVVVRDPASPLLSLAIGASLLRSYRQRYGVPGALKWPNDLFVVSAGTPGRKLGGILIDRIASPTLGSAAVVGLGVNVHLAPDALPFALVGRVASLEEFVRPLPPLFSLEQEAVDVVRSAARSLRTAEGALSTLRAVDELLYGVGRAATVDGTLRGTIVGVADDGALLIDRGAERVSIRAGDLRVEDGP